VESDNLFITLNTIQAMTLKHVYDWSMWQLGTCTDTH